VFCGCLAAGIALGMKLHQALDLALAAAAVAVTRPGTLASCPTMPELAALIEQLEFS
jgi:ribokinase